MVKLSLHSRRFERVSWVRSASHLLRIGERGVYAVRESQPSDTVHLDRHVDKSHGPRVGRDGASFRSSLATRLRRMHRWGLVRRRLDRRLRSRRAPGRGLGFSFSRSMLWAASRVAAALQGQSLRMLSLPMCRKMRRTRNATGTDQG